MGCGDEPTHAAACRAAGTPIPQGLILLLPPLGAQCWAAGGCGRPPGFGCARRGCEGGEVLARAEQWPGRARPFAASEVAQGQASSWASRGPQGDFFNPGPGVRLSVLRASPASHQGSRPLPAPAGLCGCARRTRPSLQQRYWGSTSGSHHDLEGEGSEGTAPGPQGPGTEGQLGGAGLGARPRGGRCLRAAPAPTLPAGTPTSAGG